MVTGGSDPCVISADCVMEGQSHLLQRVPLPEEIIEKKWLWVYDGWILVDEDCQPQAHWLQVSVAGSVSLWERPSPGGGGGDGVPVRVEAIGGDREEDGAYFRPDVRDSFWTPNFDFFRYFSLPFLLHHCLINFLHFFVDVSDLEALIL